MQNYLKKKEQKQRRERDLRDGLQLYRYDRKIHLFPFQIVPEPLLNIIRCKEKKIEQQLWFFFLTKKAFLDCISSWHTEFSMFTSCK